MRSLDVILMVILPMALAAGLGLVLLSGRLDLRRRRQVELALIALMYPALCGGLAWFAIGNAGEGDWLGAGLQGGLAVMLAGQGVFMARRRLRGSSAP